MRSWWQDLRIGTRSLLLRPGMTAVALATLALCIGANTAIFSVVQGVLLAPLPFAHSDRLIALYESAPRLGFPQMACSPLDFRDWQSRSRTLSSLAAFHRRRVTLTGGEPLAVTAGEVSGDFFRTLGLAPLAGRWISPSDDRPGAPRAVVLGAGLWRRRFAGDRAALGRQVTIDGVSHVVIGIAAAGMDYPAQSDLWVPLALDYAKERRGAHYLGAIGRLAPGVSLNAARHEMAAIAAALGRENPADDADWGVKLEGLQDLLVEDLRPALLILQFAVWIILLIGCVNVAHLLLARTAARGHEIAVRAALGAGRWRLMRQVGVEGLILSSAGGALGLLVAVWGTPALVATVRDSIPWPDAIGMRPAVLAYALVVSLATGAACGLLPAVAASGGVLAGALRGAGGGGRGRGGDGGWGVGGGSGVRGVAGGRRGRATRQALVAAQVALALTLLVGAGLLLRSFNRLLAVDVGFERRGAISARLTLPEVRYPDAARQAQLFGRLMERLRALPGVEAAAAIDALPLAAGGQYVQVAAEGGRSAAAGEKQAGRGNLVTADYFRAMHIPVLAGRGFSERDDLRSPPVVVLGRLAAERLFPGGAAEAGAATAAGAGAPGGGRAAIGRRVTLGKVPARPDAEWWTVVGLVGDVRASDLVSEPELAVYLPAAQLPPSRADLIVRTRNDPRQLVPAIRRAVAQVDSDLPLDRVQTLDEVVSAALGDAGVKTLLLGLFAAVAVALAALGVYGLISQFVVERQREISIRMALGARRNEVVGLMVRQGMTPVAAGLVLGLGGAYGFGRLLAGQLYKVAAVDGATFGGLLLGFAGVALVATWLPARRAARADPAAALRRE